MPLPHMVARGRVGSIPASVNTTIKHRYILITIMRHNNYGILVRVTNELINKRATCIIIST